MTTKRRKAKPQSGPDLTSVRTLVTSPSALAEHTGVSVNGVNRWIKVNRIPARRVISVANFYNVEIADLIPLTASDTPNETVVKVKDRNVLPAMLEVYRGEKPLVAACAEVGIAEISGRLIMTHWGDQLPTLYATLLKLDAGEVDLQTAMETLGVGKSTLHGLRRKYGFAPGRPTPTRPRRPTRKELQSSQREVALRVLAGKMTTEEAMAATGASYRSIFRYIERLTPLRLNALASWPMSFRAALVEEIERNLPGYAQKWVEYAEKNRLFLKKQAKYPVSPASWKNEPVKRLLVAVLLGEATMSEVAQARGGEPAMLAGVFTSDLRSLDLTFDEVMDLPLAHQIALAELLLSILDRKRRIVV